MQQTILNGPPLVADFKIKASQIISIGLKKNLNTKGFSWEISFEDGMLDDSLEASIDQWVKEYCLGKEPSLQLPVALTSLSPFTSQVLAHLKRVAFGKTVSYKELAFLSGRPKGARAVGGACGRNPCLLVVPCHRVIAEDQSLGGFTAGLEIKKILLDFERKV